MQHLRRCGRLIPAATNGPSSSAGAAAVCPAQRALAVGLTLPCRLLLCRSTWLNMKLLCVVRFGELGQTVANMLESPLAVSAQSSPVQYIGFDMQPARIQVNPAYGSAAFAIAAVSSRL